LFVKMMTSKSKLVKMKTFPSMNPIEHALDQQVLSEFMQQQHVMLELLKKACLVDLTYTQTSISLTPWLKIRLGDTFRVVIYHNQRHIAQAHRVWATIRRS
jgi:DinB superfamily